MMDSTSNVLARIAGTTLLLVGVGLGALAGLVVQRQMSLTGTIESSALIAIAVFVGLGIFLCGIGYRLAANKPNKYQSILPPIGWYILSSAFAAIGLTVGFQSIVRLEIELLGGVLVTTLLVWWCYSAATAARARINGVEPPPADLFGVTPGSRTGYFRVVTFRAIPIFVHWSLPMGGLTIAVFAGFDSQNIIYYSVGYVILITAHEAGHAIAARLLGVKVLSIDISGVGGMCYVEPPRKVSHGAIVFSAGIVVQLLILTATMIYVQIFGQPATRFGQSLATTFTIANAIVLALNMIPRRGTNGIATDGQVLWQLYLHAFRNHPNPFEKYHAVPSDQAPIFPPETSLLTIPSLVPKDFKQGVEILNDATTPMPVVVACLSRHLSMNQDEAITTMLTIHNAGGILIALTSVQRAEEVASAITAEAKQHGHVLVCRPVIAQTVSVGSFQP